MSKAKVERAMRQEWFLRAAGAFSLVEILISIIILALGLLGLGALFPVVVRQQRISTDHTYGVMAGEAARSKLSSRVFAGPGVWGYLGTRRIRTIPNGVGLGEGWQWSTGMTVGEQTYENGEWYLGTAAQPLVCTTSPETTRGFKRGAAWIGDLRSIPITSAGLDVVAPIPLVERLYPADSETPQFVWDFVPQRVTDGEKDNHPGDPIRVAVFVRRIDPRIRVLKDMTLRQMLLAENGVADAEQRSPLGEDSQGQPTLDGTDGAGNYAYSQIKSTPIEFHFDPSQTGTAFRDRLYLPQTLAAADAKKTWFSIRQPNQKLVDNLGNIYTVITTGNEAGILAADIDGDGNADYVRIDPPVPAGIVGRHAQPNGLPDEIAIREVAFTAQIPVFVTTLEVAK